MAYRALYRIYRPSLFNEVAGQDHITEVLRNQVKLGRLSHAYLFCGPRGTGKTTMAKILSRASNCLTPVDGEPCGNCEMCRISSMVNADIMEIDAASNNGVDNVRDLIDQAQFAPLQLRKRVFIIDEVHMLSVSAFNALLKTLEEPPEHVLFILATTEPEKLLPTIISRCQRFDFKRLTMGDIVDYMAKVLSNEKVSFDKDALRIIAHAADGGMRDALSLLNQCISVSGNTLTVSGVSEVLGTVGEDIVFDMAEKIIIGDGHGCMELLNTVVRSGKDLLVFTNDLSSHMRALLLSQVCGNCAELLEITEEAANRYEKQSKVVSKETLLYYCEELVKTRTSIRYFPNPRMLLETAILRMSCLEKERSQEAILARIGDLEKRLDPEQLSRLSALEQHVDSNNINRVPVSSPSSFIADYDSVPPFDLDGSVSLISKHKEASSEKHIGENTEKQLVNATEGEVSASKIPSQGQVSAGIAQTKSFQKETDIKEDGVKAVFEKFQKSLLKIDGWSKMFLTYITDKELTEDKLFLYYDPINSGRMSVLLTSSFLSKLQQAAEETREGLKTVVQEKKQAPLSAEDAHLKELFGDKLTIE